MSRVIQKVHGIPADDGNGNGRKLERRTVRPLTKQPRNDFRRRLEVNSKVEVRASVSDRTVRPSQF